MDNFVIQCHVTGQKMYRCGELSRPVTTIICKDLVNERMFEKS